LGSTAVPAWYGLQQASYAAPDPHGQPSARGTGAVGAAATALLPKPRGLAAAAAAAAALSAAASPPAAAAAATTVSATLLRVGARGAAAAHRAALPRGAHAQRAGAAPWSRELSAIKANATC
jgi:hypothetical protein